LNDVDSSIRKRSCVVVHASALSLLFPYELYRSTLEGGNKHKCYGTECAEAHSNKTGEAEGSLWENPKVEEQYRVLDEGYGNNVDYFAQPDL
jgi:hypothetical protein